MLTLNLEERDLARGSVALSWRLDQESAKAIAGEESFMVITVAPQGKAYHPRRELRFVEPLGQRMAYISFPRSGPVRIHAQIVVGASRSAVRSCALSRTMNEYGWSTLQNGGTEAMNIASWFGTRFVAPDKDTPAELDYMRYTAHLDVDVPIEAFGKGFAAWEKTFIGSFFSFTPEDECSVLRMRLLYPVFAAILAMSVGMRITLGSAMFFTFGSIPWFTYWNPVRYSFFESANEGTVTRPFWTPSEERWWPILFLPLTPSLVALFSFVNANQANGFLSSAAQGGSFLAYVGGGIIVSYVCAAIGAGLLVALTVCGMLIERILDEKSSFRVRVAKFVASTKKLMRHPAGSVPASVLTEQDAEALCSESVSAATIFTSVPRKHRRIQLYCSAIKAKACRPLPR